MKCLGGVWTFPQHTIKCIFCNAWLYWFVLLYVFVDLLSLDQSKTFYKPDWFDIVGAEVKCCKEAVCVIDMSSFTKFELTVSDDAWQLINVNQHWIT